MFAFLIAVWVNIVLASERASIDRADGTTGCTGARFFSHQSRWHSSRWESSTAGACAAIMLYDHSVSARSATPELGRAFRLESPLYLIRGGVDFIRIR